MPTYRIRQLIAFQTGARAGAEARSESGCRLDASFTMSYAYSGSNPLGNTMKLQQSGTSHGSLAHLQDNALFGVWGGQLNGGDVHVNDRVPTQPSVTRIPRSAA